MSPGTRFKEWNSAKMVRRYFLKTRRLGFGHWRDLDLGSALALWGDERVTALICASGKFSDDEVKERLTQEIACQKRHGVQYWPIFLLKSGVHVGCCGLHPYEPARGVYELGFHICSQHWRCGYAYEAAAAVIDYAFNRLNAMGLFAGHHPDNEISSYLLKNLGFRYSHDEFYPPTGLNHPSYLLRQARGNKGAARE